MLLLGFQSCLFLFLGCLNPSLLFLLLLLHTDSSRLQFLLLLKFLFPLDSSLFLSLSTSGFHRLFFFHLELCRLSDLFLGHVQTNDLLIQKSLSLLPFHFGLSISLRGLFQHPLSLEGQFFFHFPLIHHDLLICQGLFGSLGFGQGILGQ